MGHGMGSRNMLPSVQFGQVPKRTIFHPQVGSDGTTSLPIRTDLLRPFPQETGRQMKEDITLVSPLSPDQHPMK